MKLNRLILISAIILLASTLSGQEAQQPGARQNSYILIPSSSKTLSGENVETIIMVLDSSLVDGFIKITMEGAKSTRTIPVLSEDLNKSEMAQRRNATVLLKIDDLSKEPHWNVYGILKDGSRLKLEDAGWQEPPGPAEIMLRPQTSDLKIYQENASKS